MAAALGSGVAFLDGSVVNVALPAIGRELGGGFSVLQWVLDGYLRHCCIEAKGVLATAQSSKASSRGP